MLAGIGVRHSGAVAGAARQISLHSRRPLSSFAANRSAAIAPRRSGYGSNAFRSAPLAGGSVRFSSSAPDPAADASHAPSAVSDLNAVSDPNLIDLASIPEHMGYLKSLGLDFGWGPSSILQTVVEALHIHAGLPWWGTALAVAVLFRALVWKPSMISSDQTARMRHAKPLTDPLNESLKECVKRSDRAGMMKAKAQLAAVRERYGINVPKTLIQLIQIPLGFAAFRVFDGIGRLPVPGLGSESVGWLHDLSVGDPYYILPASLAALMWITVKRSRDSGLQSMGDAQGEDTMAKMQKTMMTVFPFVVFGVTSGLPSITQLYFAAASVLGYVQLHLMTIPAFRECLSITSIPVQDEANTSKKKTIDTVKTGSPSNISFIDRAIDRVTAPFISIRDEYRKQKAVEADKRNMKSSHPHHTKEGIAQAKEHDTQRRKEIDHERTLRNKERKKRHRKTTKE